MKKNRLICLLLCLLLILSAVQPVQAAQTTEPRATLPQAEADASVSSGCQGLDAQTPLENSHLLATAKSGLLYEVTSGTMVFSWNPDLPVYPGAFTKFMTALVVLEMGKPEDVIAVTQQSLDNTPSDSSMIGFVPGEELTTEQYLYAMITGSANDAAVILAEHYAGSQAAFVERMNQKAAELGCTNTTFVNAHGVHDPAQTTTARDIARILNAVIAYDLFCEVFETASYALPPAPGEENNRVLYSDNFMISQLILEAYYDYRCTGGKGSVSPDGTRSLAITAEDAGLTYIGVVLEAAPEYAEDGSYIASYKEFVDMRTVINAGFDGYEIKQILYEGQITNTCNVVNGENRVALGPIRSVDCVLPKDTAFSELTLRMQRTGGELEAPVKKGQIVDVLEVWYGGVCIAQSELVAMNGAAYRAAEAVGSGQENFDAAGFTRALAIFGGILALIGGFVLTLWIIRRVRTARYHARQRRRRNDRRRSR